MAKLMDLPDEIIDQILDIFWNNKDLDVEDMRTSGRSLALASRRLYHLVLPHYYEHALAVDVEDIMQIENGLKTRLWSRDLVQRLSIAFSVPHPDWILLNGDDVARWQRYDLAEALQNILRMVPRLRGLRIMMKWPAGRDWAGGDDFAQLPWRFDLSHCPRLEFLSLTGFLFTSEMINTLFSCAPLRMLDLADRFSETPQEDSWRSIPLLSKSRLHTLALEPRFGVSRNVLRSLLPSLCHLSSLLIVLGKDMLTARSWHEIKDQLPRNTLNWLCLRSPFLPDRIDYSLDFSDFSRLTHLTLDSVILWPVRNEFYRRQDFYMYLPPSIKRLHIYFPYSIDRSLGFLNFDGIVQANCAGNPLEDELDFFAHQEISPERYTWIENLLSCKERPDGGSVPWLPNLEYLKLLENKFYPIGHACDDGNGPFNWPDLLPRPIASKFEARNIDTNFGGRRYHMIP